MSRFARMSAVVAACALSASAHGATLAYDQYLSGTNSANGEYPSGSALNAANTTRVNFGFVNGAYASGSGTSNFVAQSTPLNSSVVNTAGGRVAWLGLANSDATNRSVARNLTASISPSTYYTSQLVTRGANPTTGGAPVAGAFVGEGFAGTAAPTGGTTSSGASTATLTGFYVGFAGTDGSTDFGSLVIRSRTSSAVASQNADTILINGQTTSTENTTYLVVTKAERGYSGGAVDRLTYWVNPTDMSSEAAMTASSIATNAAAPLDFYGLQGGRGSGSDLIRLNYAASPNATNPSGSTATLSSGSFRGAAYFDEIRLGDSLNSVVPEPATLGAIAGAVVIAIRRRR